MIIGEIIRGAENNYNTLTLLLTTLTAVGFGTILGSILTIWSQQRIEHKREKTEIKKQLIQNFLECSDEGAKMLIQLRTIDTTASYINASLNTTIKTPISSELSLKKMEELLLAINGFHNAKAKYRVKVDFLLFYLGDDKKIMDALTLMEQIVTDKEFNKLNSFELKENIIDLSVSKFQEKLLPVLNALYFRMRELINEYTH